MPLPVELTTIKVTHGRGPRAAAARSRSWIEIEVPLRTLTNHSVQSSERRSELLNLSPSPQAATAEPDTN